MCTCINARCLAVNALIESTSKGIRRISFNDVADYGVLVTEQYKRDNDIQVMLSFDPDDIRGLAANYSDFFSIDYSDNNYICLKENIDIKTVKEQFRWSLSYAMLKVLNQVSIFNILEKLEK